MKEIDNIGIIILLRLLCNDTPLRFTLSSSLPADELYSFIDRTVWQFRNVVSYKKSRLSPITVTDRTKLNELVHQYVKEYTSGELVETKSAYTSYKVLLKDFKSSIHKISYSVRQ